MNISSENKRITVPDSSELALTKGQQAVFARWEEGFDAQAKGTRFEACPISGRAKAAWCEGWLAGAAVDRFYEELKH